MTVAPTSSSNPFDPTYCQNSTEPCLLWGVSWQQLVVSGTFLLLILLMKFLIILLFVVLGKLLESYGKSHWRVAIYEGLLYWTVVLGRAGFFWLAMIFLSFPPSVTAVLQYIIPIPFVLTLFFWTNALFDTLIAIRKTESSAGTETSVAGFNELMRIIKYFSFLVVILISVEIFGGDVASFLNNAKLLGLIIVFSFQPWLKNLIGGVTVFYDTKYVLGDEVRFSDVVKGVVRDITLRTTLVECADRSVCIVPNGRLLDLPVANFSDRTKNVILIRVLLAHSVDVDSLRNLMSELKSALSILHPDILKTQLSVQQNFELVVKVFARKGETSHADKVVAQEVLLAMAEIMNARGIERRAYLATTGGGRGDGLPARDLANDFDSDMTASLFSFYLM